MKRHTPGNIVSFADSLHMMVSSKDYENIGQYVVQCGSAIYTPATLMRNKTTNKMVVQGNASGDGLMVKGRFYDFNNIDTCIAQDESAAPTEWELLLLFNNHGNIDHDVEDEEDVNGDVYMYGNSSSNGNNDEEQQKQHHLLVVHLTRI